MISYARVLSSIDTGRCTSWSSPACANFRQADLAEDRGRVTAAEVAVGRYDLASASVEEGLRAQSVSSTLHRHHVLEARRRVVTANRSRSRSCGELWQA